MSGDEVDAEQSEHSVCKYVPVIVDTEWYTVIIYEKKQAGGAVIDIFFLALFERFMTCQVRGNNHFNRLSACTELVLNG